MTYDRPIYEINIDDNFKLGVSEVALVETPAIESDWVTLNQDVEIKLAQDDEKQIVVGAALIPNKLIYRFNKKTKQEYYIRFSAETIEKIVNRYFKKGNQVNFNYEHQNDLSVAAVVNESWIIKNSEIDQSALYGFNLPVGTWMLAVHVENTEFWNEFVKTGKVKGFSIEGFFDQQLTELAEVGPRGGIKSSPKAPNSDTPNKDPKGKGSAKGDASGKRGAKVTAEQEAMLQKKADEFNEKDSNTKNGRATLGALKSVFQRGLGAFNTSSSPVVKSASQWASARVNAFLFLLKNGRPQNPKYTTDYDLLPNAHPKYVKATIQEQLSEFDLTEQEVELLITEVLLADTYSDYPISVSDNAQRALDWADENGWGPCLTAVGKRRASQLASRQRISEETIARMAAFARFLQYDNKELGDGCGKLALLAWGGRTGVTWAQRKLEQIRRDKNS